MEISWWLAIVVILCAENKNALSKKTDYKPVVTNEELADRIRHEKNEVERIRQEYVAQQVQQEVAAQRLQLEKTPPQLQLEKTPPQLQLEKTPPQLQLEKTPPQLQLEKTPPQSHHKKKTPPQSHHKKKPSKQSPAKSMQFATDKGNSKNEERMRDKAYQEETIGACSPSPCLNNGVCRMPTSGRHLFVCSCQIGFSGLKCEQVMPECDVTACTDHGDCVATDKGFLCICQTGFAGKFCEVLNHDRFIAAGTEVLQWGAVNWPTLRISLISFAFVVAIVTLVMSIHCCRVKFRRDALLTEYKASIDKGETITSLPPDWCDVSNKLCRQAFCCTACCSPFNSEVDAIELAALISDHGMSKHSQIDLSRARSDRSMSPTRIASRSRSGSRMRQSDDMDTFGDSNYSASRRFSPVRQSRMSVQRILPSTTSSRSPSRRTNSNPYRSTQKVSRDYVSAGEVTDSTAEDEVEEGY